MEKNNELPTGWVKSCLDEICDIILGQSPPSSTYNENRNGLPFFQGKADFGDLHPIPRIWCSQPQKIAESGDVLLSVRAPVGSTNLSNQQCCIGRGLSAIRPKIEEIPSKFFLYFFMNIRQDLDAKGTGTTFKAISGQQIRSLEIQLPPLNEQKRIVEKIEEFFSKIHLIVNLLKILLIQLNNQRESILTAKFQIYLEKNQTNKLHELTISRKIGLDRSRVNQFKDGTPYLKMNNITIDGKLDLDSVVYVKVDKKEFSNFSLQKDDVLFNTRNSYELVGKTTIWNNEIPNSVYNNNIMRIRTKTMLEPKFLAYFMNSKYFKNNLFSIKRATTNICAIYDKDLKNQIIPVPPINEQKIIINEIEFNLSLIENSKTMINFLLGKVNSLKSSILKQAFEGKLVPQDPNDEPASELLKRIKLQN